MPRRLERFLKQRITSRRPSLGLVFSVVVESWRPSDDPKVVDPETAVLTTRRSAAEAADFARAAVRDFSRRGYHKPSRAWWGADETHFHRFTVQAPAARPALTVVLISGVAAAAAAAFAARRRRAK